MNSYFASVEQQANPFLRGKPIGVVATMTPHGCIIASSKEAKLKGIKTGCRVKEARQLDPSIILIPNDAAKYRSATEGIMRVMRRHTEAIEPYSIDEAFLDLTGFVQNMSEAEQKVERIRQEIQDEVGSWLKCSIGLAHTRWLAKFAGDTAAKGQTLVITPETLAEHLDPKALIEAWGIGHRLAPRLQALGLTTLGDLRHYPVINLMQGFGIRGYELWANVNGIELDGVHQQRLPKTIGHSHVFTHKAKTLDYPKAILAKLCEKAGRRMRRFGFTAGGVWVSYGLPQPYGTEKVGWYPKMSGGGSRLFHPAVTDTRDIFQACWEIVTRDLPPGRFPNFLAMTLFHLHPESGQLALWSKEKKDERPLAQALDRLNNVFGEFTVSRGSFWGLTHNDAPDRVGFRKTALVDVQEDEEFTW